MESETKPSTWPLILAASRVASFAASRKLADADALRLYGFYKQALEGDCVSARPAIWDRKGRAKW